MATPATRTQTFGPHLRTQCTTATSSPQTSWPPRRSSQSVQCAQPYSHQAWLPPPPPPRAPPPAAGERGRGRQSHSGLAPRHETRAPTAVSSGRSLCPECRGAPDPEQGASLCPVIIPIRWENKVEKGIHLAKITRLISSRVTIQSIQPRAGGLQRLCS